MRRALRLALRGKGHTSPNPVVGAVIARNGRIVGEGWHRRSGEAHAEVIAIAAAGRAARGATLYVTMEPCCTYGRTPPCTDAILHAGIRRVVVGALDPNPRHHGRGIRILRRMGVRVEAGLLGGEASALNADFEKFITTGRPFTTVKAAMSLDGKIASAGGDSRWISGLAARGHAHRLRLWTDAVLVGRNTVERDDPLLTSRRAKKPVKIPWRIVLDSGGRIPLDRKLFKTPGASKTIVAVTGRAPRSKLARFEAIGARVIRCASRDGGVSLGDLWKRLGRMGIMSVLVEGGGETIASVLREGLADRIALTVSPKIIGGRRAPTPVGGEGVARVADALRVRGLSVKRVGEDFLLEGHIAPRPKR